VEVKYILFRYSPELPETEEDKNITIVNRMSDMAVKRLAKLFVELVAKYNTEN